MAKPLLCIALLILVALITWKICEGIDSKLDKWWREEQCREHEYWGDCRVIKERWKLMVVPVPGWFRAERWCDRDCEDTDCQVGKTCERTGSAEKICTIVRWCEDE